MTAREKTFTTSLAVLFSGNGPTLQTILVVGIFAPILTALVALAVSESVSMDKARINATVSNLLVASFFTITVVAILRNRRISSWIRYLMSAPFLLGIFLNLAAIIVMVNGDQLQDIVAKWKVENPTPSGHRTGNLETETDNYPLSDGAVEKITYQRPLDKSTSDVQTRSSDDFPNLYTGSNAILETKQTEANLARSNLQAENFIRSKLLPGTTLNGTAWDHSEKWPFVLTVESIDNEGFLKGQIQWPTLNSINRIQGLISGDKISFMEIEKILPGEAAIGVNYVLELSNNREFADGIWTYKGTGSARLRF